VGILLPRLYPIVDDGFLAGRGLAVERFARELKAAGVGLIQYRNKRGGPQQVLRVAALIRDAMTDSGCRLILNDRADLAVIAGWDGVHLGQEDLSPDDARRIMGSECWIGVSTHTEEQVRLAELSCADYVAVGPVFATGTKLDAEPVIGLAGVALARALTKKPIVAIGGVTRANARSVIEAGADSVAVISALIAAGESVEKVARDFLDVLR
jgi:thiamine-phosphate pyrophosphorylase